MKKFILALTVALAVGNVAFAEASAKVTPLADGETVKVEIDGYTANTPISIHITDKNGDVDFEDEMYSDENGELEFSYICTGISGKYHALFSEAEGENKVSEDYVFVSKTLYDQMVEDFKNAADYVGFYGKYFEFLDVDQAEYGLLKDDDSRAAALSDIKSHIDGEITVSSIEKAFMSAVFCARVNEARSSEVLLSLLNNEYFKKKLNMSDNIPVIGDKDVFENASDEVKSKVISDFTNGGLTTYKEFEKDFLLDIFLTTIQKAKYYTEVENVLKAYDTAELIDIDLEKYSNKSDRTAPFKAMVGREYASYSAAVSAFENYVYPSSPSSQGGVSSNTGTGGSYMPAGKPSSADNNSLVGVNNKYPSDISQALWAEKAIKSVYDKGIMSGDDNGTFRPLDNISRAETAAVLCRAANTQGMVKNVPFTDVSNGEWYFAYISAMYHKGIFSGKSSSVFAPNESITREEMAAALYRIKNVNKYEGDFRFKDDSDISDWAKESVYALYGSGIITGRDNGSFEPKAEVTRAEAAAMIYRLGGVE